MHALLALLLLLPKPHPPYVLNKKSLWFKHICVHHPDSYGARALAVMSTIISALKEIDTDFIFSVANSKHLTLQLFPIPGPALFLQPLLRFFCMVCTYTVPMPYGSCHRSMVYKWTLVRQEIVSITDTPSHSGYMIQHLTWP